MLFPKLISQGLLLVYILWLSLKRSKIAGREAYLPAQEGMLSPVWGPEQRLLPAGGDSYMRFMDQDGKSELHVVL